MISANPRASSSRSADRFSPLFDCGAPPLAFKAGDANLYRYAGNSPTNATDPSGLEEESGSRQSRYPSRIYVFPWRDFPSYDPSGGILNPAAGANTGNPVFNSWLRNDPARASRFINGFCKEYGKDCTDVSKRFNIPEALLFGTIIPEIVNFGWNDYANLGRSNGPGQLTPAIIHHYGANDLWSRDRWKWIKSQKQHLSWQYNQRLFIRKHLYFKAAILSTQLEELKVASAGGGLTSFGANIGEMSEGFLDAVGPFDSTLCGINSRKANPQAVMSSFNSVPALLVSILVSMNRENPGATNNPKGRSVYQQGSAGNLPFIGPQAWFAYQMFKRGYFRVFCPSWTLSFLSGG